MVMSQLLAQTEPIVVEVHGTTAYTKVHWNWTGTEEVVQSIRDTFLSLIEQGCRKLWVDLASIEHMSGMFYHPLILGWRRLVEVGGQFILANVPPMILELFDMTRLTHIFDIRGSILREPLVLPCPEEQSFYRSLRQEEEDPSLALIFADWLEEKDDGRAAFIRLQCDREQRSNLSADQGRLLEQERALLREHEQEWLTPLSGMVKDWTWKQGLVSSITLSGQALAEHADAIFALAPIRHICVSPCLRVSRLGMKRDWLRIFKTCPRFAELQSIQLCANHLSDEEALPLLESPYLTGLKRLHLSNNPGLGEKSRAALVQRYGSVLQF